MPTESRQDGPLSQHIERMRELTESVKVRNDRIHACQCARLWRCPKPNGRCARCGLPVIPDEGSSNAEGDR